MVYNQIVTWTAFAILAMFFVQNGTCSPFQKGIGVPFVVILVSAKLWLQTKFAKYVVLEVLYKTRPGDSEGKWVGPWLFC